MVKVVETLDTKAKSPSRLSISVAFGAGENASAEFSRVKEAILEWQKSGRAASGTLAIEIRAEESDSQGVLNAFLNTVSSNERLIHQIYRSLREAEICVVSPGGKRIKKLGFAHEDDLQGERPVPIRRV